jgi:hypothetical protein
MNSPNQTSNTITWLAMWDMYGLECLINVTEWEHKRVMAILKEENLAGYPNLQMLILRARFNSQRHYEIYSFQSADLTREDIEGQFQENPQFMADLIRSQGEKIYSDRAQNHKQVIV